VRLKDWAIKMGVPYKTAWIWFKRGQLPVKAVQLETGTILVEPEPEKPDPGVALYARVSSHDQRGDLDRQLARLSCWAADSNLRVVKTVKEVGSGLNGKRSQLLRILRDPKIGGIAVEHRDRLARLGAEYLEASLSASGRKLHVVEKGEMKDDLVQDMVDVLTSFCARLYGRRSAKNRAKRALKAVSE
jgi:putative resolvase